MEKTSNMYKESRAISVNLAAPPPGLRRHQLPFVTLTQTAPNSRLPSSCERAAIILSEFVLRKALIEIHLDSGSRHSPWHSLGTRGQLAALVIAPIRSVLLGTA
jgi:hypothetical protein